MFHLATLQLPEPITVYFPRAPRPRFGGGDPVTTTPETGTPYTIESLDLAIHPNPVTKTIHAQIAGIPNALQLYGPTDWLAIAADTPDQHAARAMQILGSDPATALQALIDRRPLPALPPRIPHEIAQWRARAVLEMQGILASVVALINSLDGEAGIVVRNAWSAGAPLARHGQTVLMLAQSLGLDDTQLDAMFIAAAALEI